MIRVQKVVFFSFLLWGCFLGVASAGFLEEVLNQMVVEASSGRAASPEFLGKYKSDVISSLERPAKTDYDHNALIYKKNISGFDVGMILVFDPSDECISETVVAEKQRIYFRNLYAKQMREKGFEKVEKGDLAWGEIYDEDDTVLYLSSDGQVGFSVREEEGASFFSYISKKYKEVSDQEKNKVWDVVVEMDGSLYPSYIISTSTMKDINGYLHKGAYRGEKNGQLGVWVRSPASNSTVKVEISGSQFIAKSTWSGVLEVAGEKYEIFPTIEYDYSKFYKVRQPELEMVTFSVYINDQPVKTIKKRVDVRPITECLYGRRTGNGYMSTRFVYAAYVNEDHPSIDTFLKKAKSYGMEDSFVGYQGTQANVFRQMQTIWYALQRENITYSSITTTSSRSQQVGSQTVRFIEDSIENTQANCVDGSVLLASIFQKIGLDTFLIGVPGHMYIGIYTAPNKKSWVALETTKLGDADIKNAHWNFLSRRDVSRENFNAAVAYANARYKQNERKFNKPGSGYYTIDIAEARERGVMVLKSENYYK